MSAISKLVPKYKFNMKNDFLVLLIITLIWFGIADNAAAQFLDPKAHERIAEQGYYLGEFIIVFVFCAIILIVFLIWRKRK